MKLTGFKRFVSIASATAVMLTMGAMALAADENTAIATIAQPAAVTAGAPSGVERVDVWSILTDEQKAQLATQQKAQLAQALAEGKLTQERYDEMIQSIDSGEMPGTKGEREEMSDEQKAQMEARRTEMDASQTKWSALSAEQKEEVYALYDQITVIESQIASKYQQLGVISSETAASMNERTEAQKSQTRTDGNMPMFGGKGGKGPGKGAPPAN